MQCWRCGRETANVDKICDICAQTVPPPVDRKSIMLRTEPTESFLPLGTIVKLCLMFAVGISVWYWLGIKEPLKYTATGNEITISNSTSSVKYALQQPMRFSGRIIDSDTPRMRLEGGAISSFVFYLTEDEYRQFENDYVKKGRCPASFLNAHSRTMALVGGSEEGAEKIRNISLKKGDRIALEGQNLTFREGSFRGMPFQFSAGRAALVVPWTLKINSREEKLQ